MRPSPSAFTEVTLYELKPFSGVVSTNDCLEPGATSVNSLMTAPSRLILRVSLPVRAEPSIDLEGAVKLIVALLAPLSPGTAVSSLTASGAVVDIPAPTLMSSSSR